MNYGVSKRTYVWPHVLAPQVRDGLPGDPVPMVGEASRPLTWLME